jgi:hypothetical protein
MIFQSSMGPRKSSCDVPIGTSQGYVCPHQKHLGGFLFQILPPSSPHLVLLQVFHKNLNVNE